MKITACEYNQFTVIQNMFSWAYYADHLQHCIHNNTHDRP